MISFEKFNKVTPVLRIIWVKMIFYPVISLCPALYCIRLYNVSNTLLCPAHYCVQHNTVSKLTQRVFCSPFTFQCAAVVSYCAWEAPQLKDMIVFKIFLYWFICRFQGKCRKMGLYLCPSYYMLLSPALYAVHLTNEPTLSNFLMPMWCGSIICTSKVPQLFL